METGCNAPKVEDDVTFGSRTKILCHDSQEGILHIIMICIYIYIYMYIYIYIYIARPRWPGSARAWTLCHNIIVYIYIYIHTYILHISPSLCIYISLSLYIYIHICICICLYVVIFGPDDAVALLGDVLEGSNHCQEGGGACC